MQQLCPPGADFTHRFLSVIIWERWLALGWEEDNKAAPMGISSSDVVTVGMTPTVSMTPAALWGWLSLEGVDCIL